MKRLVRFLVMILFLFSSFSFGVLALDNINIASGWHEFIETTDYLGDSFYVYGSADAIYPNDNDGSIFIKHNNNKTYLVGFGKCVDDGLLEFCFTNKTFDSDKISPGPGITLLPALEYSIIKIDLSTQIELSKSVSTLKPHLNELIECSTVVENTGSNTLNSISYEEVIPKGFVFVNYDKDLMLSKDRLVANIYQLSPGKKETFSYSIKAKKIHDDIDQRSVSRVKYAFDGIDGIIDEVSYKSFSVVKPYSITTFLSSKKLTRDDEVSYSFSLKNNEDKDISISDFKIIFPEEVDIKSHENLTISDSRFLYDGIISAGETITFDIDFETPFTGDYTVIYDGVISFDDLSFNIQDSDSFIVDSKGLSCKISCADTVIYLGEDQVCNLSISNKDGTSYYDLDGLFISPDDSVAISLESISSGTTRQLYSHTVDTGSFEDKTNHIVSYNATYRSSRDEVFNCYTSSSFVMKSKSSGGLFGSKTNSDEEITEKEIEKMTFIQRLKYLLSSIF